ncbi:MAG: LytTR family DNA-binding domain-containing protein [Alteromonadaceae bacterium]|jgi:two-component system LytT family response regulator|tara:strand:+ start:2024 stop:2893 length:870 start_codon:yes stop_codon:yes gene_type:complete
MTKLKALIVDDDPLALMLLREKLNKYPNISIIAECKNGREAIAATLELAPDLIFLDIKMPEIDGFGVIKKLQTDILPLIIFVTAYKQHAFDAFDVNAVDYIIKPIKDTYLQRAISRAIVRFNQKSPTEIKAKIISAIDSINVYENNSEQDTPCLRSHYDGTHNVTHFSNGVNQGINVNNLDRKIIIKDRDSITLLKQLDIEWIDAAGDYTCLHVGGVTHIKRCTLKDLLIDLDPEIFKRVHRSTIVNLNYVTKVIPHTKGEYFLLLGEFDQIKVSRKYREIIKHYLVNT